MKTQITLTAPTPRTARTTQLAGMFDYELGAAQTLTWTHDLPIEDRPWQVGLIVGPSGSGKSVLAREIWGQAVRERHEWVAPALIDDFPRDASIADVTATLTAVGFGTVPAWLRPYATLSNGEQFRADMARAIIEAPDPIVIDEFTSVVDRQVARVASHAVQKTIRRAGKKFVAVTCHYDVEDWLQPDWIYDVSAQAFTWRLVQPHPPIQLDIHPAPRSLWPVFERHHYLSGSLSSSATCYAAYVDQQPVAFTSYRHFPHAKVRDIKMGHRLVVLPDWQGLGIATALETWLGERLTAQGLRYRNVVAHPAMIRLYARSPRWRDCGASKSVATGKRGVSGLKQSQLSSRRLAVRSFEYVPARKEVPNA